MRILEFCIENLGSFENSGGIKLGPALNFVVGQNNSGKTALISSLSALSGNAHRDSITYQRERVRKPKQTFRVILNGSELANAILRDGNNLFWPSNGPSVADQERAKQEIDAFLRRRDIEFLLERKFGADFDVVSGLHYSTNVSYYMQSSLDVDGGAFIGQMKSGVSQNLKTFFDTIWNSDVFFFNAQRYNVGVCDATLPSRLNSDASNLPAVLMRLSGDRGDVFRELVQHMRDIFPSVKNLSVSGVEASTSLEILIWPTVEQPRRELSVGLNQSGTGLSQVLAILAVAMTVERGVIVIDEISSFLHPAAAKALVRILEAHYPHHQYVISTHSPEVISASSPSTIHLVRKAGFKSEVSPVNVEQIDDLRMLTSELGVSMTDVFAADRIIWVEGPTEAAAFPYIYEQTRVDSQDERRSKAPQFTAVATTGDFGSKRARPELIFEIYDRLSTAAATLSASTTFCFDSEELTDQQAADLKRRAKGRLMLLPRRHFECYLISPKCIASVLSDEIGKSGDMIEMVETFLENNGGSSKYKAKDEWNGDVSDVAWLEKVDAANLLKDLFASVTGSALAYSKRRHSFAILKKALEQDDPCVLGLVDFVGDLVALSRRDPGAFD